MGLMHRWCGLWTLGLLGVIASSSGAEVEIVHAHLQRVADGLWRAEVTLRHDDTGWDHYADAWRITGGDGEEHGTRTLLHPHENEQPFTRSLRGVAIPPGTGTVYVEAHDSVHGWSADRIEVDLNADAGPRYTVSR